MNGRGRGWASRSRPADTGSGEQVPVAPASPKDDQEKRDAIVERIRRINLRAPAGETTLGLLKKLRGY